MSKLIFQILLLLFVFNACKKNDELLFIKDKRYFEPDFRFDQIINDDSLFVLNRRYFVYNYASNKLLFDSLSINLMCKLLNDSILLSNCYLNFQKVGKFISYNKNQNITADFTETIVIYSWDISKPNIISSEWGSSSNKKKNNIRFKCKLNSNYKNHISF